MEEGNSRDEFFTNIFWGNYDDAYKMIESGFDTKPIASEALYKIAFRIFKDRIDHDLITVGFYRDRTVDFYQRTGQMDRYYALNHQPLNSAIENILIHLLDQGIDFEQSFSRDALILACQTKSLELVKLFVEKGQNVNVMEEDLLMKAFDYKTYDNCCEFCTYHKNKKFKVCKFNPKPNIQLVRYLIEKGANVNCHNGYPIKYACKYGDEQLLKLLIDKGVNQDVEDLADIIIEYNHKELHDIVKNLI
jgi:hypothetical protein